MIFCIIRFSSYYYCIVIINNSINIVIIIFIIFIFLILQPLHRFTYVTAHYSTLLSLYLHYSSFFNLSITSPTSQLILQPLCRFTYVTAHSPTLPLFHLHHISFSNPSFASPTSQALHLNHLASRPWSSHCRVWECNAFLQPFHSFTYITTHSPTLPSLYLRHSSISNPSFASPTSQALHINHLASRPVLHHY